MERTLYFVSPVASDARFARKRAVVDRLGRELGFTALYPMDRLAEFGSEGRAPYPLSEVGRLMRESAMVVVDLSFERPSCYFELGVAQSVHDRVALIAERGTTIHQHGGHSDVHLYQSIEQYGEVLESVISAMLRLSPQG